MNTILSTLASMLAIIVAILGYLLYSFYHNPEKFLMSKGAMRIKVHESTILCDELRDKSGMSIMLIDSGKSEKCLEAFDWNNDGKIDSIKYFNPDRNSLTFDFDADGRWDAESNISGGVVTFQANYKDKVYLCYEVGDNHFQFHADDGYTYEVSLRDGINGWRFIKIGEK